MLHKEVFDGWIYIRVPEGADLRGMLAEIGKAPAPGRTSLLIDASLLRDFDDPTTHAILGEHMAERFHRFDKVAVLVSEDNITYNSERAAQQRRLNLRVFTRRDEAELWLSETA